jgi:hypothetical protein
VSKNTVGRLLKQMDFKLRVNRKQIASTKSPDRNQQFLYIGRQREQFAAQGLPIISVDAKKKELIGNFKNTGARWDRDPILVKDHDFRSEAEDLATLDHRHPQRLCLSGDKQRARFCGAIHGRG